MKQDLEVALEKLDTINQLVQEATDEIEAFAAGAQASMEHGSDLVTVFRLLEAIGARAQMLSDNISFEVDEVAPKVADDSRVQRAAAVRARWQRTAAQEAEA